MCENLYEQLVGRRILIVEDMHAIAMDLLWILNKAGCTVVGPAPNVMQALKLIESKPIDGAVMDINLGDEKVFPVALKLQELNIPFMFLSSYNHDQGMPVALRQTPRLDKPFIEHVLLSKIAELFTNREKYGTHTV